MITLVAGILQDDGCSIESQQGPWHPVSSNDVGHDDVREDIEHGLAS